MPKRILIVDDEAELLEMLRIRLEASNYEVITASDAADGLKKTRQLKPHLVILDILMPGMDGTSVASALRQDPATRDIPIIFLTGIIKEAETRERRDGNVFIAKPFDTAELLLTVRQLIGQEKES
jgi:CheY-like chemotaxis protein